MSSRTIEVESDNSRGVCPIVIHGDLESSTKGLVVIQEWWGMTDDIVETAKTIGSEGNFITAVPDLYRGKKAKDFEEAGHLRESLDWTGAIADVQATARYLLKYGCTSVGVTGFCMGGALTLSVADKCIPEISAVVPFYGVPRDEDCSHIKVPVQAHYAVFDKTPANKTAYNKLRSTMENAGVNLQFYEYQCDHAFFKQSGPAYNKEAADLALSRMVKFLNDKLF